MADPGALEVLMAAALVFIIFTPVSCDAGAAPPREASSSATAATSAAVGVPAEAVAASAPIPFACLPTAGSLCPDDYMRRSYRCCCCCHYGYDCYSLSSDCRLWLDTDFGC